MKKIISVIATVLLIVSLLCINVFAEGENVRTLEDFPEPMPGVVMRVMALKKDGTYAPIGDFASFETAWSEAMTNAKNDKLKKKGYVAVEVLLYADWIAEDGKFTDKTNNPTGFNWDAINVPEDSTVIFNLNGHTIDRGLTEWENNGEVISIHDNATVIINGGKNASDPTEGTITGGYSAQFGGGIHIKESANVTLNNINVVGNRVEDASGAGISVAKNSTLTMNGGSVSNNESAWTYTIWVFNADNNGIGVYASEGSTLVFNDVDFEDNTIYGGKYNIKGAAIFASEDVDLTVTNCRFNGNGKKIEGGYAAESVIETQYNCSVTVKDTVFKENGDVFYSDTEIRTSIPTRMLCLKGEVLVEGCTFDKNTMGIIFHISSATATIKNCTVTDNECVNVLMYYHESGSGDSVVSGCTFKDNIQRKAVDDHNYSFVFNQIKNKNNVTFTADNVFGDEVTFKNKDKVTFLSEESAHVGSIFSSGSIPVIISIVALCVSICTVVVCYINNKKLKSMMQK